MGDDNGIGIVVFIWIMTVIAALAIGHFYGKTNMAEHVVKQCVIKYGDMPANKVKQHCSEILGLKND